MRRRNTTRALPSMAGSSQPFPLVSVITDVPVTVKLTRTASGHAEGWGTAVECQDAACVGTMAAHGKSVSHGMTGLI